jgi:hypothetical protein
MNNKSAIKPETTIYSARLKEMLLGGEFSDVMLLLSDEVKFKLHKFVLAEKSEYFYNLLKQNEKKHIFQVNQIQREVFEDLVNFMYDRPIVINSSNVMKLLLGAHLVSF